MSLFQVLTAAELSGRSLGQLPCYMDCSAAAEISGRRPPGSLVVWIIHIKSSNLDNFEVLHKILKF
jgi:hypothetical protein